MLPRIIRSLVIAGALFAGYALARPGRRAIGVAMAAMILIAIAMGFLLVARFAHRAFEEGRHRQASILYRILKLALWDRPSRAAVDVSLAGCRLAADDFEGALAELEAIDGKVLGGAARAAWLNNRAYARGRAGVASVEALEDVDAAMKLRPDVPGYRHTRGVVLLALGRLDEAIADLDSVWPHLADDKAPNPLLEAERCYDLAVAWERKNEIDYARDYYRRARAVAPSSTWAARASEWLQRHPRSEPLTPELETTIPPAKRPSRPPTEAA